MRKKKRKYQSLLYQPCILNAKNYRRKVLSTERASLIGFWPQNERSGSVSHDHSGLGHNGVFVGGLRLGQPGVPGMGMPSALFAEATENLIANPSVETNTTGWTPDTPNTLERSTEQAKEGTYGLKCIWGGGAAPWMVFTPLTLTAVPYVATLDLYIPSDYDGTDLVLYFANFAGSTGTSHDVNMTIVDQWQRIDCSVTPDAGDLLGQLALRENGGGTAGKFIYIDAMQLEAKAYATPYCDGSLGTGFTWTGAEHASTSTREGTYNDIYSAGLANDNLLLNLGFETAGALPPTFANWADTVGDGAIADELVLMYQGAHAAKLTAGVNRNTQLTQTVIVVPGETYRIRFYTQGDGVNDGRFHLWDVNNGAYILPITATGITAAAYGQYSIEFTAPAGCISASFSLRCPSVDGGICYYDACEIRRINGFLGDEGTILMWSSVANADIWGDGVPRRLVTIQVDADNYLLLDKPSANSIRGIYRAGATTETGTQLDITTLDFFTFAMTWSKTADEIKYYYNGNLIETDTALGTWAGDLGINVALIGAGSKVPDFAWTGNFAPTLLYNKALSQPKIAYLSTP